LVDGVWSGDEEANVRAFAKVISKA